MKKHIILIIVLFSVHYQLLSQLQDPNTPKDVLPSNKALGQQWRLDFSDEFNDLQLNWKKWSVQVSEKSREPRPNLSIKAWYWRPNRVKVTQGKLVLNALKFDKKTMYCGSVNTRKKYEFTFGYIETSIKIAETSKGVHTAFWLQQAPHQRQEDNTGRDGSEMDFFESAWEGNFCKSAFHIDGYGKQHKSKTKRADIQNLHDGKYHIWGAHWTKDFVHIYYDNKRIISYTDPIWISHAKEYLWLSVGASFGFKPMATNFTAQKTGELTNAHVDYIRVWKAKE